MTKYTVKDEVEWKWGNGTAHGNVEKIEYNTTKIQSKGEAVTRNGTKDNPAIVIRQNDGTKIIKLASELL